MILKPFEIAFGVGLLFGGVGLLSFSVAHAGPGWRAVWMIGAFLGGGMVGLVVRHWVRRRLNISSCA